MARSSCYKNQIQIVGKYFVGSLIRSYAHTEAASWKFANEVELGICGFPHSLKSSLYFLEVSDWYNAEGFLR